RKEGCRWNSPLCIAVGRTTPGVERLPDGAPTRHYRLPYPTTGSKSTWLGETRRPPGMANRGPPGDGRSWSRRRTGAALGRRPTGGWQTAAVALCTLHDLAAGVKLALAPVAAGVLLAAESPPHAVAVGGRPRLGVAGRLGAVQVVAHRPIRRR